MVPDLIWVPDFFGPQEILAPYEHHYTVFLGPKKVRGQKEIGDQFSYSLRLSMKGKVDVDLLQPFGKKLISLL